VDGFRLENVVTRDNTFGTMPHILNGNGTKLVEFNVFKQNHNQLV